MIRQITAAVCAVLGITTILALTPTARAFQFQPLTNYFSFAHGDGNIPENIPNSTGQQISPDGSAIKLFGQCGPILGSEYANGFVQYWNGPVSGAVNPGDTFRTDFNFEVQASGGVLAWSYYAEMYSTEESVRILTDLIPIGASGQVTNVQLESAPFTMIGEAHDFQSYLHIDWSGYGPTDTLTLIVPQNSVDVTYVPEPTTVGLLPLAMVWGLGRRNRAR